MRRLLVPSAALCWGLQFAFLNSALALLLVELYDASATEVGAALAAYNASGFVASLLVPAWADRRGNYLRPLLICGVLTLVFARALATVTSLPAVVVALVVVGEASSSPTLREVVRNVLGDREIPVLAGVEFGHAGPNLPMPVGVRAALDAERRELSLLEPVCRCAT